MKFPRMFLIIAATLVAAADGNQAEKSKLSVLLYPWVPDYEHIAKTVEQKFESENPGIDLIVSAQNWGYYEPGGLDAPYDIYELDGIFLHDFVQAGRIQPLNPKVVPIRPDVLKPAGQAVAIGGSVYAIPHWACALFTFHFSHDAKVAAANKRAELVSAIGSNHERGRGLLIDWKGHSTLAELYADCLLDLGLSPEETLRALADSELQAEAKTALSELIVLSDTGSGRTDVAHKAWPPYYAFEFAHARGRALVGYSERMHHILQEIATPTEATPVIDARSVSVKLYNQGGKTGVPLLWVDSFAIAKSVTGVKLEAAQKFLNFVARDDIYRAVLLPSGKAPQYLLPTYKNVFTDTALLEAAPLYSKFLPRLDDAVSLAAPGLPKNLEAIGELLDKKLPVNLQRP